MQPDQAVLYLSFENLLKLDELVETLLGIRLKLLIFDLEWTLQPKPPFHQKMRKSKLFSFFTDKFSLSYWRAVWVNTSESKWKNKQDQLVEIMLTNLLVLVEQLHSAVLGGFSKLVLAEKPKWQSINQIPARFFGMVKQRSRFIFQPGASFPRSRLPADKEAQYLPTLQRGLKMAQGKLSTSEIDVCQQPISDPLVWEHVHSILTDFQLLKISRYVRQEQEGESLVERVVYLLPDEYTYEEFRRILVYSIRPANPTLVVILLQVLAQGKIVPTSPQEDQSTYLNDIAVQLADFPYLAIWLGVQELRGRLVDRTFPATHEILRRVQIRSENITDSFDFFAYIPFS
jgi:hypothetical protein